MTDDPIARMREEFIADASERVNNLYNILATLGPERAPTREQVDQLFRAAHSLKGTAAMFDLAPVSRVAASVEDVLDLVRAGDGRLRPDMTELLVEAFDEMLLIFRSARGEDVTLRTDDLVARMDALVTVPEVQEATGAESSKGQKEQKEISQLSLVLENLAPSESEVLQALIDQGRAVYTIRLCSGARRVQGLQEAAIRRLQECGEVLAVLPEQGSAGPYGLTIVHALVGAEEKLSALAKEIGASVERLEDGIDSGRQGKASAAAEAGQRDFEVKKETGNAQRAVSPGLTVKVDIKTLDSVMNTLSELYSVRLGLLGVARRVPSTTETRRIRDDLLKLSLLLNKRVVELEESIIDARLEPVSILFDRYRGEVRRLAKRSGKKVSLRFEGEATRVDRAMLSRLYDPLLHMIRNAVDHGIEAGPERLAAGKPEEGSLTLRARQEASHICLDIEDDGGGIDPGRVRKAASEKGLDVESDKDVFAAIFEPGVSTKEGVTDISGRGVGLDAVKSQVEAMRGVINVDSSPGRGARFSIWVPLTLAVSRGILLTEGDVPVVLPLGSVLEVTALSKSEVLAAQRNGILTYNGAQIKVADLSRMLGTKRCSDVRSALILGIGGQKRALISQRVCGETEIVSRPLPEAALAPGYIAGASELHDGRPAIVIQPDELLRASATDARGPAGTELLARPQGMVEPVGLDSDKDLDVLIFNSGGGHRALPLFLLKEILPLKASTRLPVLGEQWLGIFFVRGLCHGLLSPESGEANGAAIARNAAILEWPKRCGVAVGQAIGHFNIRVDELRPFSKANGYGLISTCACFTWEGHEVTLLDAGGILSESLTHPAVS